MSQIKIENPGCNGWATYESQYIEGGSAKNIHVVEAMVTCDANGKVTGAKPNAKLETVCKRYKLVKEGRKYGVAATDASTMRMLLAKLQNDGNEVCGHCVAHFYADQD